jgi:AraC-like DNA-binding protein
MALLRILHELAGKKKIRALSSMGYSTRLNQSESLRLNGIYAYILEHFRKDIDLAAVSSFASMTPQAFSRYFRKCTRRTFISFLNEVRIGYACRLLSEQSMSVSQICYESGYSNLSNFNRQFKRIKGMTPSQYARGFDPS